MKPEKLKAYLREQKWRSISSLQETAGAIIYGLGELAEVSEISLLPELWTMRVRVIYKGESFILKFFFSGPDEKLEGWLEIYVMDLSGGSVPNEFAKRYPKYLSRYAIHPIAKNDELVLGADFDDLSNTSRLAAGLESLLEQKRWLDQIISGGSKDEIDATLSEKNVELADHNAQTVH